MAKSIDTFKTKKTLTANGKTYSYYSLPDFYKSGDAAAAKLPYSLKILLENLLRFEDGSVVKKSDILALSKWNAKAEPDTEIQFTPARTVLQDFTGVPAITDLAAMRGALKKLGGDPKRINPLQPADLVIDHSFQVDEYGTGQALEKNMALEFDRNKERYAFLRWGQTAFKNFRVVPPQTGIVHQVNLEYLAHLAMVMESDGDTLIYPDTLVGTDSHTTMINGLGILGWGVGGIEAEAAMLGQPCSMLIPQVVGFRLKGKLSPGVTATDLVLTVTEMLRKKGVVGKFVEFFGPALPSLPVADRATIANMAPEYGATVGLFPVDERTMDYLKLTGRGDRVPLLETYFKAQGLWYSANDPETAYTDTLELDLSSVEPSLAGPARPQDRVALKKAPQSFKKFLVQSYEKELSTVSPAQLSQWVENPSDKKGPIEYEMDSLPNELGPINKRSAVKLADGQKFYLNHGSVVIASITSCTNTSNPSVLIAAGLVAKKAVEKGLQTRPWVKTSLAPGSRTVTDYLSNSGLMPYLEALRFHPVGYGCATCIGNSGPLPDHISKAITENNLAVASVLSGNRNFEGRVHNLVRANYLASPPLVVAYALAGNITLNLTNEPLGFDPQGNPVFLKDIWPSQEEVASTIEKFVTSEQYKKSYQNVFAGAKVWQDLPTPQGELYDWDKNSTYIKEPTFFADMKSEPTPVKGIKGARVLAYLGDSVTTDHISPAGSIAKSSSAAKYLQSLGVQPVDFNQYGARRGNFEVMVRGTFANVRLKNFLVPGIEGGVTKYIGSNGVPEEEVISIFDASEKYRKAGTPVIVIGGKEYGTGSSRDWAAKGPYLLGIRAVIAESFERIHRSNLVGMAVLPLQFKSGENAKSLGLTGLESFEILGLEDLKLGQHIKINATDAKGAVKAFEVLSRIDTPNELEYFKHGGILQYVLRQIAAKK